MIYKIKHILGNKKFKSKVEFVCFILPALLLLLNSSIIPFVMNIYFSLMKWNGVSNVKEFVGLNNFIKIFTSDKAFWEHTLFTFKYLIFFVVAVNIIALGIALLLYKKSTMNNFARASIFLPYVISLITVGLIWQFIFGPGFESIANITGIELFSRGWMSEVDLVLYSILITSLWQNVGFFMIIYIAGLVSMPSSVIEAAKIDGANAINTFTRIKLPFLAPSLTICLFQAITYGLKLFEIVLVLTRGGPGGYSTTIVYNIYIEAFQNSRYGYGTAKSLVFFIIVLIITLTQLNLTKRMEVET